MREPEWEKARQIIESCPVDHLIEGIKSVIECREPEGVGSGAACQKCIAQALKSARSETLESAAHVAEAHIRIRWAGTERRERNLEQVIAQAIRKLKEKP